MKYRPEIDGIRTLAILPVLVYHLKIPMGDGYVLPGGFLGVDLFLVISGFLITRIILEEMQSTGTFSITNFYMRRARRILPALVMVIIATMIAGLFVLYPTQLSRLGVSSLAALGFVSNAYWFVALGDYGAPSGLLQPLLHTWSLAIEEQFYVVFPLVLLAIAPSRRTTLAFALVFAMLVVSLIVAEATTIWNKQLSFFSPASRAWELLVGAALAFGLTYYPGALKPSAALVKAVPKVALAVIVVCFLTIDLASWNHPGLITVPVVVATAGIIWCAQPGEAVTNLLSTRPFVFVGRISYSLYLWHYPIFAYGRLSNVEKPDVFDMAAWVAVTFVCAIAGYYLVEQRFRFGASTRVFWGSMAVGLAAAVAFVVVDMRTDLLKQVRNNSLTNLYGGEFYDNEVLRHQTWRILDELAGKDEKIGSWNAHNPSKNERANLWFDNEELPNILVIGNSHSKDMFNALHLSGRLDTDYELARFAITTHFPEEQRRALYSSPNFENADIVLISTRYPDDVEALLPGFVADIQGYGKTVAIVGGTPEFISPGSVPIFDWHVHRNGTNAGVQEINRLSYDWQDGSVAHLNETLTAIAEQTGAVYLSRGELVCSSSEQSCFLATEDGIKTMYDYGHWTMEGARHFGARAIDLGWLDQLVAAARM